jgi:cGMP-dependent protein kinase
MQYIEGVDFFDMLREIGLCNTQVSCFYVASLLLCIQELHTHNIVYRDLKPENAVIDTKGYLYMIDLGTAKKLTE